VSEILRHNTHQTKNLLEKELLIRMEELETDWHFSSLEKIFIENRIYHDIEQCETWEEVITAIDSGLKPFIVNLRREITVEDIERLTEIKIKRISKYNAFKADEYIKGLENEMEEVKNHLANLVEYTINFYRQIKKKYGTGRERKTELRSFDTIQAAAVAANNERLYVNRNEGFAGFSLKKDEFVCECSDIDDVIVFRENGTFLVTKVSPKFFVGEHIIHINVFRKNDDRTIYNLIYRDGKKGPYFVKRFAVVGVTRDKEYDLTGGKPDSKVMYFTANPNGEAESLKISLRPQPKLRRTSFEFDFSTLAIKGRSSKGNTLTKHVIRQIVKRDEGVSTLGAREIWYDDTVKRLNTDQRGTLIGAFMSDDKLLHLFENGEVKLSGYDLSTHFEDDLRQIMKFEPDDTFTVIYTEGETGFYYMKRFQLEDEIPVNKRFSLVGDHPDAKLKHILFDDFPQIQLVYDVNEKGKKPEDEIIDAVQFIGTKSYKAKGRRLTTHPLASLEILEPLEPEIPEEEEENGIENEELLEYDNESKEENVAEAAINEIVINDEKSVTEEETENERSLKNPGEGPKQMEIEF
ncbi:MAG: DNA gyrase/topoisomerase IV subunit A, partial [Bacteroidales bacterium]